MSEKQVEANNNEKQLPTQAHWLQYFIISGIGLVFLNGSMVYLSIPSIATTFQATDEMKWIPLSYFLSFIFVFFLHNQLLQRFRARYVGLAGSSLFSIGSALCGTSLLFWQLVLSQVIQGIGGSLLLFALLSAADQQLSTAEGNRQQRIAALAGGIAGLLLGGFVVEFLHWHVIFLVNVFIGLAFYYFGLWLLPQEEPQLERSIQIVNSLFAVFLLLFLAMGLSPYWDIVGIPTFLFIIIALVLAFVWLKLQKKWSDSPSFVYQEPAADFEKNVIVSSLHALVGSALIFLFPFFWAKELKWSMLQVGLIMVFCVLIAVGVSILRKRFLTSLSAQTLILVHSVILLFGLIVCLPLDPQWNTFDLIWRGFIFGIGYGLYPFALPTSYFARNDNSAKAMNSFVRYSGWFFGPIFCSLIWTPNMLDQLSNRPDMRIVLFMLILLIISSIIFLYGRSIFLYFRRFLQRIEKNQTE